MKIILQELFDSPVYFKSKFKKNQRENDIYNATFTVKGINYQFDAYEQSTGGQWEMSFGIMNQADKISDPIGITGTGNAVIVFSTIVAIIKRFVAEANPPIFTFTASMKEESRVKIYTLFANRISTLLPTYKFVGKRKTWFKDMEYKFKRK